MAGILTWRCSTCGRKVKVPASTWPELRPEPNGHVHRFERAARGRPRRDLIDEKPGPELAGDTVDVEELEGLDQQFGDPVGPWFDRARRGRKR